MHDKAQLEPTRHFVVLECQFACCLLYNVHAVRQAVSQCENLTVLSFLDQVHQILGACREVSVD